MYYCGGNALDPKLKTLGWRKGTNFECFRKGIGVGKNQPAEPEPYLPLYPKKSVYCGNAGVLPRGYDEMGTPPECLRKGVGVGKMILRRKLGKNEPIDTVKSRSQWETLALFAAGFAFIAFLITGKIAWFVASLIFFAFGGLRIAEWVRMQ